MKSIDDITYELKRPFDPRLISWRVSHTTKDKGKAMVLAYIDARDVMKRLDEVMGIGGWQNNYTNLTPHGVICNLALKLDGEWVWKANGAGDTKVEAEKGAQSDAFKRAAVLFGIGRYLYQIDSPWVACTYKDSDRDKKYPSFTPPTLPKWATPDGFDELMKGKK